MQTKLTLRLESALIDQAKQHARQQGKSLSVMVADYFAQLGRSQPEQSSEAQHGPVTRRLRGLLAQATADDLDEAAWRAHQEQRQR